MDTAVTGCVVAVSAAFSWYYKKKKIKNKKDSPAGARTLDISVDLVTQRRRLKSRTLYQLSYKG